MTVAEYIAARLAEAGCRHVFAISGAGNMFLFDAIDRNPELEYVCPHHEQAATMAAVAYTRMTNHERMGVAMTTAGPGAINAVTGLLNGWADSIPMVVLSGQEKTASIAVGRELRMWGVQGFDVVRTVSPFCKYAVMLTDPQTVAYHVDRALYEARNGRPGPVWIDVPMDVQSARIDVEQLERFVPPVVEKNDLSAIAARVARMIEGAERPVLLLGNGIRLAGGQQLVPELMAKVPAPVITAWSGMDMVPAQTARFYGHAGVYGGRCGNFVVQNADLVVAIGSRLAIPQVGYDLSEYARGARKVMVDVDPVELKKLEAMVDVPVQADAREFIEALLVELGPVSFDAWVGQCEEWKQHYPLIEPEHHTNGHRAINTYRFIDVLNRHLTGEDLVVADAGAAHTSTQQVIAIQPGMKFIATTGLGEMGYGLPAAIGAAFARPEKRVVLITGDGSMMMNLQELQTIVHHQLPVKIFLYDNDGYLTIRNTQNALFGGRQAGSGGKTGVTCPDFVKVAQAFGIPTLEIEDYADVSEGIARTFAMPGPVVTVVYTDPKQVFVPKLSISTSANGALVSPPLEDLSPLIAREQLEQEMIVGVHAKSRELEVEQPVAARS